MKDITVFLTEQLQINEEKEVKDEKSFREFAKAMAKEAFGDEFDEDKFKKTVDGFLEDNKDLVEKGDWAEVVGKWEEGFTKED